MSFSNKMDIPLYVVSGGIMEIIEASFSTIIYNGEIKCDYARACWETMGIFSNSFQYDGDTTIDYVRPIIHILNKKEFIY